MKQPAALLGPRAFAAGLVTFTAGIRTPVAGLVAVALIGTAFGQAPSLPSPALRTNPSNEYLLKRAEQYIGQKRYALAAQLWQNVINASQDTVSTNAALQATLTSQYKIFRPLLPSIEKKIAKQPVEALNAYRLRADGEAKALLAKATDPEARELALTDIGNRLFLSSEGDEAVMELAGRHLDQFEFVAAERLLTKLVTTHPTPSIDLNQAKLQLALASGRNQNMAKAEKLLNELRQAKARPETILDAVEASVKDAQAPASADSAAASTGWTMAGGSPLRQGVMPALPDAPLKSYEHKWTQPFTLVAPAGLEDALEREDDHFGDDTPLITEWINRDLRPVASLRFGGSSLFFQNDQRLIGVRASTGRIQKAFPVTGFKDPSVTEGQNVVRFGRVEKVQTKGPRTQTESQMFYSSLDQSALWMDDTIYMLERPDLETVRKPTPRVQPRFIGGAFQLPTAGRARKNRLVAYGANPRKPTAEIWSIKLQNEGCFVGEPVAYKQFLLVPVLELNRLDLMAIERTSGKEMWRAYLCEEQRDSVDPHAEVLVAVAGDDAYVLSGNGILTSIEASSGILHWSLQHARSVTKQNVRFAGTRSQVNGWKKNHLIVAGPHLICMPSDMDRFFMVDRRTGMLRWQGTMSFPEDDSTPYPLGLANGRLYIASSKTVRAYNLEGGRCVRVRPDRPLDDEDKDFQGYLESHGRGFLTNKEIVLPDGTDLLRFDLDLNLLERHALDEDADVPLGNLFSDGARLYHCGLRSVEAYAPKPRPPAAPKNPGKDTGEPEASTGKEPSP